MASARTAFLQCVSEQYANELMIDKILARARVPRMIAPLAVRSFRARATSSGGLDAALRLTFDFWYCGVRIRPAQVRSEIAQFLGVISSHPPQVVLEVGTANGGSFFLLSRVASSEALLVSVDLPGGTFGGGYPSWRVPLYKSFARGNQRIRLLRADSHDPETVRQVLELLEGRPVDLLFIDGDHTYSGVKADLEMYSPLVRVGGLIGFHDIVPGPEADVGGVPRLWEEIKARVQTNEIVEDWHQGGYGIGYFCKEDPNAIG